MTTIVEDVPAVVEIENLIDSKVDGLGTDELRELARMLFRKADDLDLRWLNMVDDRRSDYRNCGRDERRQGGDTGRGYRDDNRRG